MSSKGPCYYCGTEGPIRVTPEEDGVSDNIYVCIKCWSLLKNPSTALPFLRGHVSLSCRNQMPKKELDERLNSFMELISKWEPRN